MRTTLVIDDDVLLAVRERARAHGRTTGQELSALAREALTRGPAAQRSERNGLPVLSSRGEVALDELVNTIRRDESI